MFKTTNSKYIHTIYYYQMFLNKSEKEYVTAMLSWFSKILQVNILKTPLHIAIMTL